MKLRKITLIELFDSDFDGLMGMRGSLFEDKVTELYHRALIAYHQSDIIGMKAAQKETQNPWVSDLIELRVQTRTKEFQEELIQKMTEQADSDSPWSGELHFILSNITAARDDHAKALHHSLRAAQYLRAIGAKKKAVRSLLNAVSAESTLRPEKHYISDLYHILREAKSAGDRPSMGTTLMNLSRQYQKLGCFQTAVKFANRAIRLLTLNAGKLDFQIALAHRCHLNCQMGRFSEAYLDWEQAQSCSFEEVHSALKLIESEFSELKRQADGESKNLAPKTLLPMWKERLGEKAPLSLSKLEQKLIELLCEKPRTRKELVELLYGDRLSTDVVENRFYNLMNRIRKRHPGLIQNLQSQYRLTEKSVFPNMKRKLGS